MGKKGNWVKVYRDLLDQPFWKEKPFSKGQAWIDIMLRVYWKNSYVRVGNRKRKVRPGQLWITYQELADRWGWSKSAVNRFLHELSETDRATLNGTAYGTLITLKNWDLYQLGETPSETLPETVPEIPTIYIKNKEEITDPFGEDDEGMTEEELREFLRV